jgi:hypothetical protein
MINGLFVFRHALLFHMLDCPKRFSLITQYAKLITMVNVFYTQIVISV